MRACRSSRYTDYCSTAELAVVHCDSVRFMQLHSLSGRGYREVHRSVTVGLTITHRVSSVVDDA